MYSWNTKPKVAITAAVVFSIASIVLLTFYPAVTFDFLNYDDPLYVTHNPYVLGGLNLNNLKWAFTNLEGGFWQPLVWLSLMQDASIFGISPWGFHLTNVLLHCANSVLAFLATLQLTRDRLTALLAALMFGLHPLRTEPVAWIASRKDLLSTFFGLLALLAYGKYTTAPRDSSYKSGWSSHPALWYSISLLCFAASLMSKTSLVILPFLLLILDWWPFRRISYPISAHRLLPVLAEKIPFLLLSIGAGILTVLAEIEVGAVARSDPTPFLFRIGVALTNYAIYLWQTVWPIELAIVYPAAQALAIELVLGAALLIIGLTAIGLLVAKSHRFVLSGWLWFLVTLAPVCGIVQVGPHMHADRYTYFPSLGLFLVVACFLSKFLQRRASTFRAACLVGIVLVFAGLTRWQLKFWCNSGTVFQRALAVTKNNYIAHLNYGAWLAEQGNLTQALEQFKLARAISSQDPMVLINLALTHCELGETNVAVNLLREIETCSITSRDPSIYLALAQCWRRCGNLSNALAHCKTALKESPEYSPGLALMSELALESGSTNSAVELARTVVGKNWSTPHPYVAAANVLLQAGQPNLALAAIQRAYTLSQDHTPTLELLATILLVLNRPSEAVEYFERVRNTGHISVNGLNNLACAYLSLNRPTDAISLLLEAIGQNKYNPRTFLLLGRAYRAIGDQARARVWYERAASKTPGTVEILSELGEFLAHCGDFPAAIDAYRKALTAEPDSPDLHCNLGTLLYAIGEHVDGINHLKEALRVNPDHAMANNNLGRILLDKGDLTNALVLLEKAARLAPDSPMIRSNLSLALAKLSSATNSAPPQLPTKVP